MPITTVCCIEHVLIIITLSECIYANGIRAATDCLIARTRPFMHTTDSMEPITRTTNSLWKETPVPMGRARSRVNEAAWEQVTGHRDNYDRPPPQSTCARAYRDFGHADWPNFVI